MPSLLELVDRVNKGEVIDVQLLEVYQDSANSAEKFLAHHACAMLDLRRAQQHILQSLEAIDYSDQKVLNEFISVSGFLGQTDLRAQPVVKFGAMAINRREWALGIEAIQNGVAYDLANGGAFTGDRENCLFVAQQYDRAAAAIGWTSGQTLEWNNKQPRIAFVVSGIADDDSSGRMLRSFAKYSDVSRYRTQVYSTECGVRRDRQQFVQASYVTGSFKRGARTLESLAGKKIGVWIAPTEGDSVSAARDLAQQLVKDKIDIVIFDTNQSDPIACVIAAWDCAPVKINLCRGTPMYASGINCVTYFDQARYDLDREFWQKKGIDSKYILEGVDLDDAINGAAPQRNAYGIPEQSVVLATAGADLDRSLSEEFVDAMIQILRANTNAVYLLIGDGELAWQRRKFDSAGVSKRVGYAGGRRDLPSFIRIADAYLAEFPNAGAKGVLQAMAAQKPVVAMKWGEEPSQLQAATIVGSEAAIIGRDIGGYIERVTRIIKEPGYRAKLGCSMRGRVEQHFGFAQTTRHLEQLCEQFIQRRSGGMIEPAPQVSHDGDGQMAAVA